MNDQLKKRFLAFLWILLFSLSLALGSMNIVEASGNDISNTIEKFEAKRLGANRYQINGTFKNRKAIRPDDYLQIDWDKNGTALTQNKTIYLGDLAVGEFEVENDQAKLIFNDNIAKKSIYGGEFNFEILVDDEVLIAAGKKELNLEAGKNKVSQNFYSLNTELTSRDNKNYVKYIFGLNNLEEKLDSDIILDAKVSDDKKIEAVLINLDDKEYNLAEFQKKYPETKLEIDRNSISAKFNREEYDQKKIKIAIITKPVEDKSSYEISSKVQYQLKDQNKEKVEISDKVRNFKVNVTLMQPFSGNLQILKLYQDKDGKMKPLSGVTFSISKQNGFELGNYTTDKDGLINLKELEYGIYILKEVRAPEFIDFDEVKDKTWTVEIKDNDGKPFVIVNNMKKTEINEKAEIDKNVTLFNSQKKKLTDYAEDSAIKTTIPKNEAAKTLSKVDAKLNGKTSQNLHNDEVKDDTLSDKNETSYKKKKCKLPQAGESTQKISFIGFFIVCLAIKILFCEFFKDFT